MTDLHRNDELISECCGVPMYDDCDICPDCKEHTTAILEDEDE